MATKIKYLLPLMQNILCAKNQIARPHGFRDIEDLVVSTVAMVTKKPSSPWQPK